MRVVILEGEQYPFYSIKEDSGKWSIEVPTETVERWKRVMDEFWKVQDEMVNACQDDGANAS